MQTKKNSTAQRKKKRQGNKYMQLQERYTYLNGNKKREGNMYDAMIDIGGYM